MDLKIKSKLKRAMSNRALQVVKCSQRKTSNIKPSNDVSSNELSNQNSNQLLSDATPSSATKPIFNLNKIVLQPIKTVGKSPF
jgi:hypothetical protein